MSDTPKPKSRERFCWVCGDSMGPIEDRYFDRLDTCGKRDCEREARDVAQNQNPEWSV